MKILFGCILALVFFYWNYKIIQTDIKEKRIPNRCLLCLLYLLPFWYIYAWYFGYVGGLDIGTFLLQTFLTFLVSFTLFHFGLWGAGDAKYLLVLSLFIPHIGVIPFIGNIAIITLLYLLFYFIWFWIGPNLWIKTRRNNLYTNLWKTKKDAFLHAQQHKTKRDMFYEVLKWLNIFLLVFISLRLTRLYLFDFILQHYDLNYSDIIHYLFYSQLGFYIILAIGASIFCSILIFKYIFSRLRNFFGKYNSQFLICLNIFGIGFLIFEYLKDAKDLGDKLFLIFTLYLGLYIIFKMLLFGYKLVFVANEESWIHIKNLQEGMKLDLNSLRIKFGYRKGYDSTIPEIPHILENLSTNICEKDILAIVRAHELLDEYNYLHTDQTKRNSYTPHHQIKILNTFSYGVYIIGGFGLSILFGFFTKFIV